MPLRYSKVLRRIFKEILHMQRIGQLNADTDDELREHLRKHRKAIRELQLLADKRQQCPALVLSLGLTRGQYDPRNANLSTNEAAHEGFKQLRVSEAEMWADKRAPPSVVYLLVNTEQRSDEGLQQQGEHSFNDEMNGISPENRKKMDADDFGDGVK